MFPFLRFNGPRNIPIFYQQVPELIKHTAIALPVFTGSADDLSIGMPGVHHWFEHVPFRGTENFPGGYTDTMGRINKVWGNLNAWTSAYCTNYWVTVPNNHLELGIDMVTDLVACPLLTDEAIEAERRVIEQEIRSKQSSLEGMLSYKRLEILLKGHPLANHTLGTISSLNQMTPDTLRLARKHGYDISRMAFVISSALPIGEIMRKLCAPCNKLPSSDSIKPRLRGASFGKMPWQSGMTTLETSFRSSSLEIAFPVPAVKTEYDSIRMTMLRRLFNFGGLGSPLYRAVRENKQLCYNASALWYGSRDGGFFRFQVTTEQTKLEEVEGALRTMFDDPQLRSPEWFTTIKDAVSEAHNMDTLNPESAVDKTVRELTTFGHVTDEDTDLATIMGLDHATVLGWIDELSFDNAYTIVAVGNG